MSISARNWRPARPDRQLGQREECTDDSLLQYRDEQRSRWRTARNAPKAQADTGRTTTSTPHPDPRSQHPEPPSRQPHLGRNPWSAPTTELWAPTRIRSVTWRLRWL